jgi:hypothetical protein
MRYPWHPWHGGHVWIRRSSLRSSTPVFQCTLDPDSHIRLLEIPQWMFDATAVCLIRLAASPIASCDALRELKELISLGKTANDKVIQAQHQSLFPTGGSDVKRSEVTRSNAVAVVSAADHSASLGELTARSWLPLRVEPVKMGALLPVAPMTTLAHCSETPKVTGIDKVTFYDTPITAIPLTPMHL